MGMSTATCAGCLHDLITVASHTFYTFSSLAGEGNGDAHFLRTVPFQLVFQVVC